MSAQDVTLALGGRWRGRYGSAMCPAHDNHRTPALSLSDGENDMLLLKCHAGCSFLDIIDALKGRGISTGEMPEYSTTQANTIARKNAERTLARSVEYLWGETEDIRGTPAETYLRKRGVTCELPDSLRYYSNCWHATATWHPTMVALIEGADGPAVIRTYLTMDGSKAEIDPNKAMLGHALGGHVSLSKSTGPLVVCEGIETGLSLLSGLLDERCTVWAALTSSGMKSIKLPARASHLIVATDGDEPGREAGYVLAERASRLGWKVEMLPAPDDCDFNDVLLCGGKT